MKLNKNDIYYYLSKKQFMNVDIYSKQFKLQYINSGGDISYSIGSESYSSRESAIFKQSARELIKNEYQGLPLYENIGFAFIINDGIYFDVTFENNEFEYKLNAVIMQSGIKTIIEFKNTTKWKDEMLLRYFTIMLSIGNESFNSKFRYITYIRSNKKGNVGSVFLDSLTMTGNTGIEFDKIWNTNTPFQVLYLDHIYHKKNGTLLAKLDKFLTEKYEAFSDDFDDLITRTKNMKEAGTTSSEEAMLSPEPCKDIVAIDQRIKCLYADKKFVPKTTISEVQKKYFEKIIKNMTGKKIIFYDFETLNPKISLFDNYPSNGTGVAAQVSIYESTIESLDTYREIEGVLVDTFTVSSMKDFHKIVNKLYLKDAIYVTHSKHEKRILTIIKDYAGTPQEIIEKIDYINNNNLDTAELFKIINQYNFSSIKIIEKFLKTQDGIYEKFKLEDYSDLDVSNGFEAMDVFLNMQLFGDTEPYRIEDVRASMIIYCNQDVRMMIAILYWWKEIWLKTVMVEKTE